MQVSTEGWRSCFFKQPLNAPTPAAQVEAGLFHDITPLREEIVVEEEKFNFKILFEMVISAVPWSNSELSLPVRNLEISCKKII